MFLDFPKIETSGRRDRDLDSTQKEDRSEDKSKLRDASLVTRAGFMPNEIGSGRELRQ